MRPEDRSPDYIAALIEFRSSLSPWARERLDRAIEEEIV